MHFIASFVTATLALAPLHHRSPLPLSVPKRATLKTGYYNIANSLGPLLTLNTNTNVTGNGTVSLPQSQVWAVTELAGNYLIPNNGAGAALQGFGSKFLNEGGHLVEGVAVAPGNAAQLWTFTAVVTDVYNIVNVGSQLYLDIQQSNTTDGTPVITYPYNGGFKNQQWSLKAVA
ncbi:carbohydrate-binding module family 13 protein [Melanomma pulvis-pyrius CBS 109.77]|uniref:Carbohydrate-binding module family 13 protein n=1 Tax=Melanomma pulvis-pyrius CBS 109.77 TaxID=1314802 RepID=A0A6A6XU01_9PLEO|nr:carbohydrate-binding module family 13 protein [Melanomma pulvis-pyrius CBS 109.77]